VLWLGLGFRVRISDHVGICSRPRPGFSIRFSTVSRVRVSESCQTATLVNVRM